MTCLVGSDPHGGLCVATAQRPRLRVAAMPSRLLFALLVVTAGLSVASPAPASEPLRLLNDVAHVYSLGWERSAVQHRPRGTTILTADRSVGATRTRGG